MNTVTVRDCPHPFDAAGQAAVPVVTWPAGAVVGTARNWRRAGKDISFDLALSGAAERVSLEFFLGRSYVRTVCLIGGVADVPVVAEAR